MARAKVRYWAVCYAHVCRWSRAASASEAAMDTFGVRLDDRMTVVEAPWNPRYAAQYRKMEFLEEVAKLHKDRTGHVIK
jgi:hypothetical protein